MIVLRFRNSSEVEGLLKKAKKMYKFTKELVECLEDKYEDGYEDDDEEYETEYRNGGEAYGGGAGSGSQMRRGRYRRGM